MTDALATKRMAGAWASDAFERFDPTRVPSPCFVIDETAIAANLAVLEQVQRASGARVLSALKAFSMPRLGPMIAAGLSGTCASGLHEALLAREAYGGEVHVYSAGYAGPDLEQLLTFADHVLFNSVEQWLRFRPHCIEARKHRPDLSYGLRVNPEHSEGTVPIYDACAPGSRLGIPRAELDAALADTPDALDGIDGLHFHTLCEQGLGPLARTLQAFEHRFGDLLPRMRWLNVGGGHHITARDYDVDALITLLREAADRHAVQMYIEPGEALAIHAGVLVASVLDIGRERTEPDTGLAYRQTILDTSATCHMPDTLEMPYRAHVLGATQPGSSSGHVHVHRFGGMTCLAGDRIGDYAFAEPLQIGDRVVFDDMAHYTMVKTTTFNGVPLPSIALWNSRSDALEVVAEFGYEAFRSRLG